MSRDVGLYLADILEMMAAAERFTAGKTAKTFCRSVRTVPRNVSSGNA